MTIALLLLAAVTAAPVADAGPKADIVVRGTSLQALRDEVDRCVARRCPVHADVVAAVRYAEGLFRTGRYLDGREALQKAIARDRPRAQADPLAVAALYEATATIAMHEGEQAVERRATYDRAQLLRATQPPGSPDILDADLAIADLALRRGDVLNALQQYRALLVRAQAAHDPAIAAAATLRLAQADHAQGEDAHADQLLDALIADAACPVGYRLAAYAVKARIARPQAQAAAQAAFRAALARNPQRTPVLLSAPPPPLPTDIVNLDYFNRVDTHTMSGDILPLRWADIGFSIRPDGSVDTPDMLRGNLPAGDAAAIVKAIGRRGYAPFTPQEGASYRVERWTLTADYAVPQGSLIRQRIRNPHYAALDITTAATAPPPGGSGGGGG